MESTKGRLVSKGFFEILEFFQKTNETIRSQYRLAKKPNSFVRFWKNRQLEKNITTLSDLYKHTMYTDVYGLYTEQ